MYPIRLILRPILVCCILLNSVAVENNNAWYDLVGTREIKSVSFKNILVKGGFQEDSQNETEWHRALAKLLRAGTSPAALLCGRCSGHLRDASRQQRPSM